MRGPVNSTIKLRIARPGVAAPFDITLKRDVVHVKSVKSELKGDIGYIRITTFLNETTASELEKAIAALNAKAGGKLVGFIVDLRNNPGGLLEQGVGVADDFLDGGEIVSVRGRRAGDAQRYDAHRGDLTSGKPLVVLINGGSASASEIVAGALQDHKRAVLIGTRSFGKGLVQSIIPLNGGADGAIHLTTANYFTPSGKSIQTKGIDPDIRVEDRDCRPKIRPAAAKPNFRTTSETRTARHRLPSRRRSRPMRRRRARHPSSAKTPAPTSSSSAPSPTCIRRAALNSARKPAASVRANDAASKSLRSSFDRLRMRLLLNPHGKLYHPELVEGRTMSRSLRSWWIPLCSRASTH